MSQARTRKKIGINEAGYQVPRFNLESRKFIWIKEMRSAGSRAAADAMVRLQRGKSYFDHYLGRVLISTYQVEIQDLPIELDGIRVVHLTDIHHGPWFPIESVEELVARANQLKPDLVALTGDFVANSSRYIEPVATALGGLKPSIGSVAVMGNHDWWEGGEQMRQALEEVSIPLVDNSRLILTPDRKLVSAADAGLAIAGVGDAWEDVVDFEKAVGGLPATMPRLVLSHNPDCAEDRKLLRAGHRIDLMLSGHTHGGQVCFPANGNPMLPRMRKSRYSRGLVMGPVCPVYISRGIGTAGVPVRLGVSPEIAVFDLVGHGRAEPFPADSDRG